MKKLFIMFGCLIAWAPLCLAQQESSFDPNLTETEVLDRVLGEEQKTTPKVAVQPQTVPANSAQTQAVSAKSQPTFALIERKTISVENDQSAFETCAVTGITQCVDLGGMGDEEIEEGSIEEIRRLGNNQDIMFTVLLDGASEEFQLKLGELELEKDRVNVEGLSWVINTQGVNDQKEIDPAHVLVKSQTGTKHLLSHFELKKDDAKKKDIKNEVDGLITYFIQGESSAELVSTRKCLTDLSQGHFDQIDLMTQGAKVGLLNKAKYQTGSDLQQNISDFIKDIHSPQYKEFVQGIEKFYLDYVFVFGLNDALNEIKTFCSKQ